MKLEPVYLVGPPPTPKTTTTRRAFLWASCAAVGAGAAGLASGLLLGGSGPEPASPAQPTPEDARLKWLRGLCDDKTPLDELIRHRGSLMLYLPDYRDDALLWHGIERLGSAVIEDRNLTDRRRLAIELLAFLDHGLVAVGFDLQTLVQGLREVVRGR